jgi:hypothetical protein
MKALKKIIIVKLLSLKNNIEELFQNKPFYNRIYSIQPKDISYSKSSKGLSQTISMLENHFRQYLNFVAYGTFLGILQNNEKYRTKGSFIY